jgi:hypothetical protein
VTSSARGRILFVLHEPGYFRFYGPTIVELGRRGWEVRLAFDRPDKRDTPQVPQGAGPEVVSLGALPEVRGNRLEALRSAMDYLRYLEAPFAGAAYLRRRAEKTLAPSFRFLTRIPRLPRVIMGLTIRLMRLLERAVAPDPAIVHFVRALAPDAVFVSPLVTPGPIGERQTEVVKAARAVGVPAIVGTASWDHLTSKGLVRTVPDALLVWNDAQVREAVDLHRIPRSRVIVTGAQSLDHWFEPVPPGSTAAFRAGLGIVPGRRVILFAGSSRNMAPGTSEVSFVRRWAAALRVASSLELRDAFLMVRPHPTNADAWRTEAPIPGVVVHPREYSGIPLADAEVEVFRQSLLASDAVVGINTTAMIEAAVLRRPVLTVRDVEFTHSQSQTLHFGHLPIEAGGCAVVAGHLDDHVRQLEDVLREPTASLEAARRFVQRFVRPCGDDQPATRHVCAAIEALAGRPGRHRRREPQRPAEDEAFARAGRAAP